MVVVVLAVVSPLWLPFAALWLKAMCVAPHLPGITPSTLSILAGSGCLLLLPLPAHALQVDVCGDDAEMLKRIADIILAEGHARSIAGSNLREDKYKFDAAQQAHHAQPLQYRRSA